jgi:hypothetical protein
MAICLSSLTRLGTFFLGFDSPRSRPDKSSRHDLSLFTRVHLPALIELSFLGISGYIEDLVARINAPLLFNVWVGLYNQLLFDTSQIRQFIGRTDNFKIPYRAVVQFTSITATLEHYPFASTRGDPRLGFEI